MFNGTTPFEKRSPPTHVHSASSRSTRGSQGNSETLFSDSFHNRSKISEKRYNFDSEDSLRSEIDPSLMESDENGGKKSGVKIDPGVKTTHQRQRSSHHRTKSIYIEPKHTQILSELKNQRPDPHIHAQSELPKHVRKASDADSVVLAGPGDESFLQRESVKLQKCALDQAVSVVAIGFSDPRHPANLTLPGPETRTSTKLRLIPALGDLYVLCRPCTAFCPHCKRDVHTEVTFHSNSTSRLSGTFLSVIGNLFACCEVPNWLSKLKVHKCSVCGNIIARSV